MYSVLTSTYQWYVPYILLNRVMNEAEGATFAGRESCQAPCRLEASHSELQLLLWAQPSTFGFPSGVGLREIDVNAIRGFIRSRNVEINDVRGSNPGPKP